MVARVCEREKGARETCSMKKIGSYVWAFLAMLAAVIVLGFATIGTPVSAGDSMTCFAGKTVSYQFVGGSKTVESVYVNVGAIYDKIGSTAKIEVEYSSSTTSTSGTDIATPYQMSNIASTAGKDGLNYNWQQVVSGVNKTANRLFFKSDKSLELCEIVAFDNDGNRIEMMPASLTAPYAMEECLKTLDAQERLTKDFLDDKSMRKVFTQEEGVTLTAINTLGAKEYQGLTYNLDGNFGVLATAFSAASVGIFGVSPFALRLPSMLAAAASIVFLFLLCKELFKSEKYAFFASVFFVLGGILTAVGRLGSPYIMVASALIAGAYFAYCFFAKGISANAPIRSGLNVFAAGALCALAIVMETLAVVPALGVLVLVGFGVRRVFLAEKMAKAKLGVGEKAEEISEEKKAKLAEIQKEYSYKKRVSIAFSLLSFVAVTFVLLLIVGVAFYKPFVLAYDNAGEHSKSFLELLFANVLDSAKADFLPTAAAAKGSIFAWLLPFSSDVLYSAKVGSQTMVWSASMNMGLSFLSLAALAFVTVKVAYGFAVKTKDKVDLRIRRAYFVFLVAMATSMIAAGAKGAPTVLASTLFTAALFSFVPLAALTLETCSCKNKQTVINVILLATVVAALVFFVIGSLATVGATKPLVGGNSGDGDEWTGNY